jgi:hypothetical protein
LALALGFEMKHSSVNTLCDAEDDPKEWPGPKAWPATLALISFFAVNVFGQVATCILHHSSALFSTSKRPVHVPMTARASFWDSFHVEPIYCEEPAA